MSDQTSRTAIGLDENLVGALAYALGWLSGVVLLVVERENQFVRFHALQSTLVFGALCAIWFVAPAIVFFGWIVSFIVIPPVSAVVWLLMLFKAYHGERYKLPLVGDFAEQRT
jgi:uncharacterized membrane protein